MLEGDEEPVFETGNFSAGPSRRTRLIAFAALTLGAAVIGGLVLWAALQQQTAGATTEQTEPATASNDEPDETTPTAIEFDEAAIEKELAEAPLGKPEEPQDAPTKADTESPPEETSPAPEEAEEDDEPEVQEEKKATKVAKKKPRRRTRRRRPRRRKPEPKKEAEKKLFKRFGIDDGKEPAKAAPRIA
jgi:outer membrane biosynthesis protein TonB